MSERSSPAVDQPTLFVSSGGFIVPLGGSAPVTNIGYTHQTFAQAPITDANVLYTVATPPTHGTILLSGAPTTAFTHQNVNDGLVTYQHDGTSSPTDGFQVFARITEVPGVINPYTPAFYVNPPTPSGTSNGAFQAGVLLAGSTLMPTLDYFGGAYAASNARGVATLSLNTTRPNQVVFVLTYSHGSTLSLPYPSGVPIASVAYPGLTFTRLGGGSFNTIVYDAVHAVYHYTTVDAELFYATTAFVISSATLTATWTVTGPSGPEQCGIFCSSYDKLADLAHPWTTNPGSIQLNTTTTLPGALSLTTTVSDTLVLPVLFSVVAANYNSTGTYGPMGFSQIGGGSSSGGTLGNSIINSHQRTGIAYATVPIAISGAPPEVATLAMDDLVVTTDADMLTENLISLRWSDDRGHSWGNPVSQSIGEAGEYRASLQWQRLAYARSRVFEISWSVPMATALLGCYVDATPGQS